MKNLIVIYGGRSAEREISVLTAFSVLKSIDYSRYTVKSVFISKEGSWVKGPVYTAPPLEENQLHLTYGEEASQPTGEIISPSVISDLGEIAFPLLHGPMGEDGTIQGFFETIGMPYVGCGVMASANGMDKILTKYLLEIAKIPQVPFVPVSAVEWKEEKEKVIQRCLGIAKFPMFVKPSNMGSSVGITRAENIAELEDAIQVAFEYDGRVVVEQGVDAREIEVGLLGNGDIQTTLPGEIVKDVAFYDYNAKYIDNKITMAIPAEISEETMALARTYAKRAFKILDGSGLARCDFFLTKDGELFLNELNTMPGFTQFSMYPSLWKNMGIEYADLIERLIQLGEERFAQREKYFEK
ncbi:MAG: D-alanine--D-alanine ligase [Streptococcaceae bacterium]|nr:D-alanine--D-alanine ligase [Streptococcaceae bacterium]